MDADEERDYADQDPLSDMDMQEDAEILATLLKHIVSHIPSCMNADDIEQLLQDRWCNEVLKSVRAFRPSQFTQGIRILKTI
jgi:hypothetical protein